jgi:hypothetical protein
MLSPVRAPCGLFGVLIYFRGSKALPCRCAQRVPCKKDPSKKASKVASGRGGLVSWGGSAFERGRAERELIASLGETCGVGRTHRRRFRATVAAAPVVAGHPKRRLFVQT